MNDNIHTRYLENQFLIAMPQMLDSYFTNTVTYLWKHNEEGALGIVINKPLKTLQTSQTSPEHRQTNSKHSPSIPQKTPSKDPAKLY